MSLFSKYRGPSSRGGMSLLDQPIGLEHSRARAAQEGQVRGSAQQENRYQRVARRAYRQALRNKDFGAAMQAIDWVDGKSGGMNPGITQAGVGMGMAERPAGAGGIRQAGRDGSGSAFRQAGRDGGGSAFSRNGEDDFGPRFLLGFSPKEEEEKERILSSESGAFGAFEKEKQKRRSFSSLVRDKMLPSLFD